MANANTQFGGFLTNVGVVKQTNANALQIPWKITRMELGDAGGEPALFPDPTPSPTQTALINVVYDAPLNALYPSPTDPGVLIAELVLPPNVGGWWIRETALRDEDGDLIAVAKPAPSYKPLLVQNTGRTQTIRMHIVVGNTANIALKIDPGVVLATRAVVEAGDAAARAYAQQLAAQGKEYAEGLVEDAATEATQAEAEAGENGTRKMTPRRVFQALRSAAANASETLRGVLRIGTQAEIDAGESAAVAVTPRTLMKGAGIHRRAEFFESGTWRCPPGVTRIQVTGSGGGGGGGGPVSGGSSYGQGGGGGASALCVSLEVIPGAEYTVSIGAAGNGGGVGGNGTAGGATSFASLLTLTGGAGGLAAGSGSGGGGGAPSPEHPGTSRGGNGADGLAGGHGGGSPFGAGGSARSSAGSAGMGWGSGGAAGRAGTGGGPGAPGFLIVEW